MGIEPNKLDYLVLSKGNFEILIRKLLLVRRYRVEIYVAEGSVRACEWTVKYKGSPGYFSQLEEILGDGLGSSEEQAPCLMAVNIKTDTVTKGRLLGVACVTPGEYAMSVSEFTDDDLLTELETITVQMAPSECLVLPTDNEDYKYLKKVMERANVTVTAVKKTNFSTEGLNQDLNRLLKFKDGQQQDANAFPEMSKEVAMTSLAATIKYTSLLDDNTNFGRFQLTTIQPDCFLHMDAAALKALNVFPELGDTNHAPSRSLYGLLDRCRTQHGKRLLAQWLRQPLRDINLINERQDIVELLMNNTQLRQQLHEDHLRRIPDLQALARRLTRKKANLQDCYRIYQAINRLPALLQCLAEANDATLHSSLAEPIAELNNDLEKYQQMIEATVDMDAVERGDYLVKPSFDEQLQSLADQLETLQSSADKELNKAARELGLDAAKTIKLESNPQNGFNFRVTLKEEHGLRGNKKYTIIDAVKSGVRFKNSALESITEEYLQTKSAYEKEQDKVVTEIIGIASGYAECLRGLSLQLSRADVLLAFALAARAAPAPYCRPALSRAPHELLLLGLRHPCLEVQEGVSFIPNDVVFRRGEPDEPPSDSMVEMLEAAAILRTATPDSLVLIDELGRGTSTYEGCGIAWAIAEKLATEIKCFCLFATHYHELTRLASLHPNVIVNSHAEASVVDQQLVLLHKILPGPATQSLGLHVAKLADLPDSIIQYAEEKQAQLETNLFEVESAFKSEDNTEGQKLILDFLHKCKEIHNTISSDDEMLIEINKLKQQMLQKDSKYVQALMSTL
nr:DNA mismatch repair protein Msh2 [Vanessa tameamea]